MRAPRGSIARASAIATLSLVLVGSIAFGVLVSPIFHARNIRVSGADSIGETEILRMAGVSPSTNVLRVSPGALEARLEQSPWIASASVERNLPSTLSISVVTRTPAAVSKAAGGYAVIAGDGTILALDKQSPGLPEIDGAPRTVSVGDRPPGIVAESAVAGSLSETVAAQVESIATGKLGLELHLANGTVVTWGDATGASDKASALAGILQWATENHANVRSIDVSAPHTPAAKVAGNPGLVPPAP